MVKQEGITLFTGNIGNLSFYKTREGYFARQRTCIPGARVKHDPEFARTRNHASEFAVAARAGKLLRAGFKSLMTIADSRVTSRLAGALSKVIHADTTHPEGQRTTMGQHMKLLKGFNFNCHGSLDKTLLAEYTASIDRTTNSFAIHIASFNPSKSLRMPPGATHMRLTACAVSADFTAGTFENSISYSPDLSLKRNNVRAPRAARLHPHSWRTADLPSAECTIPRAHGQGNGYHQQQRTQRYGYCQRGRRIGSRSRRQKGS